MFTMATIAALPVDATDGSARETEGGGESSQESGDTPVDRPADSTLWYLITAGGALLVIAVVTVTVAASRARRSARAPAEGGARAGAGDAA